MLVQIIIVPTLYCCNYRRNSAQGCSHKYRIQYEIIETHTRTRACTHTHACTAHRKPNTHTHARRQVILYTHTVVWSKMQLVRLEMFPSVYGLETFWKKRSNGCVINCWPIKGRDRIPNNCGGAPRMSTMTNMHRHLNRKHRAMALLDFAGTCNINCIVLGQLRFADDTVDIGGTQKEYTIGFAHSFDS